MLRLRNNDIATGVALDNGLVEMQIDQPTLEEVDFGTVVPVAALVCCLH